MFDLKGIVAFIISLRKNQVCEWARRREMRNAPMTFHFHFRICYIQFIQFINPFRCRRISYVSFCIWNKWTKLKYWFYWNEWIVFRWKIVLCLWMVVEWILAEFQNVWIKYVFDCWIRKFSFGRENTVYSCLSNNMNGTSPCSPWCVWDFTFSSLKHRFNLLGVQRSYIYHQQD